MFMLNFATFSVNGCRRSKCVYIFHLLINKSVFTVYLHNGMNVLQMQFLDVSVKVGKNKCGRGGE